MLKYKAIIFDLGGVILNLDQERTIRSFKRLNLDLDIINDKLPIFKHFEIGKVDTETFIQTLKAELKGNASELEIEKAWNNMILNVPIERIEILKYLKTKYKIFVLSNTNELHIQEFANIFEKDHPTESWENLFNKIYYSHQIGLRKPDLAAWKIILEENNLTPNETIFIVDTLMHHKAAETLGIKSIWTKKPIDKWFLEELKNFEKL